MNKPDFSPSFPTQAEGEDSLKKMQLMELAILNGTYRDANIKSRKHGVRAGPGGACGFGLAAVAAVLGKGRP